MASLEQHFEKLWRGETSTRSPEHHPFFALDQIERLTPAASFYKGFVNLAVVDTDEGCVLLDTGSFHPAAQARQFAAVRSVSDARLHSAIYTHGHVDHAYGLPPFLAEAERRGFARPAVIGHEAVAPRMQRYIDTAGYNAIINSRQFGVPIEWPVDPIVPTTTYATRLELSIGGRAFELYHARGETDDHTWIHVPDQKLIYTGDLFIWAAPNAGNPQKVQRYVLEWAHALRAMAALSAELLLPGHGLPVFGADNVRQVLGDCAEYLESIHAQTLALLNQGATVYDVVHSIEVPRHLVDKPYLQPVYDEPEFIARNLYRCYGGWYSGIPSELKPAEPLRQAAEVVALAGGVSPLLERASALAEAGDLRLACHLVDWAVLATPDDGGAQRLRAAIYEQRVEAESSTMAKGIYRAAARSSRERSGEG